MSASRRKPGSANWDRNNAAKRRIFNADGIIDAASRRDAADPEIALTTRTHLRPYLALALAVTLAIGLSACGRRGSLEVPTRSGAPAPKPAAEAAPPSTFSPGAPTSKPKVVVPSKEPFVLDPLL
jgi:predicted small lipoprotein YifL